MTTELNATDRARLRAQIIDEKLAAALVAHVSGAPRAQLRAAIKTFVVNAKATMTPPQDVIVSVKAHVQRDAQPHVSADEYPRLVQLVVGWTIEDYYQT